MRKLMIECYLQANKKNGNITTLRLNGIVKIFY